MRAGIDEYGVYTIQSHVRVDRVEAQCGGGCGTFGAFGAFGRYILGLFGDSALFLFIFLFRSFLRFLRDVMF